jgi:hypothetical protein
VAKGKSARARAYREALNAVETLGRQAQADVDALLGGFKPIEFGGPAKPKRQRDYAAEYRNRIYKGLVLRGETRAEARGHRAEGRRRVGTSRELEPRLVPGYLDRLAERRNVKVVAYLESGGVHVIGRGKPKAMAEWFRDTLEADSLGAGMKYEQQGDEIASIRVFFE